jgi:hypothetical protein
LISIYEKSSSDFERPGPSTIYRNIPQTIFQPREIDNSLSPNPRFAPAGDIQNEPDERDETPAPTEAPEEDSEDNKAEIENQDEDKAEAESSDEETDEEKAETENPNEDRADNENSDEEKADQNQQ